MQIEIICTGDEVLTGNIINTNFAYMSQKLGEFDFFVKWETTVGDDREDLLQAFQRAGRPDDARKQYQTGHAARGGRLG